MSKHGTLSSLICTFATTEFHRPLPDTISGGLERGLTSEARESEALTAPGTARTWGSKPLSASGTLPGLKLPNYHSRGRHGTELFMADVICDDSSTEQHSIQ